eukprot:g76825.t1
MSMNKENEATSRSQVQEGRGVNARKEIIQSPQRFVKEQTGMKFRTEIQSPQGSKSDQTQSPHRNFKDITFEKTPIKWQGANITPLKKYDGLPHSPSFASVAARSAANGSVVVAPTARELMPPPPPPRVALGLSGRPTGSLAGPVVPRPPDSSPEKDIDAKRIWQELQKIVRFQEEMAARQAEMAVQVQQLLVMLQRTQTAPMSPLQGPPGTPPRFPDNSKYVAEAQRLLNNPTTQEALSRYRRNPPPLRWKCFLSVVRQRESVDACRTLARYMKDMECEAWYDNQAEKLSMLDMLEGVAGSGVFVVYGTVDYFKKAWCLFELEAARLLNKTIVTVRDASLSHDALSYYDVALVDRHVIAVSRAYWKDFVSQVVGRVLVGYSSAQHLQQRAALGTEAQREAFDKGGVLHQRAIKLFYGGEGLARDRPKALALLQQAVDAGYAESQYRLGLCYRGGEGVVKDETKTVALWQKAAEQRHAEAQAALGFYYAMGKGGVVRDECKATQLFQQAAEQGNAHGQANLGVCYAHGQGGLAKDERKAAKLYQAAAEQGNAWAQANLGIFYANGRGGLAQDERKAALLYQKAADQGNAGGQTNLGWLYENGKGGLAKDERRAAQLYQQAMEQGDGQGQANLGWLYENGKGGLAKDKRRAAHLYKLAADQGNTTGQVNLGFFYEKGQGGLSKNKRKAIQLYQIAAAKENDFAIKALKRLGVTLQRPLSLSLAPSPFGSASMSQLQVLGPLPAHSISRFSQRVTI